MRIKLFRSHIWFFRSPHPQQKSQFIKTAEPSKHRKRNQAAHKLTLLEGKFEGGVHLEFGAKKIKKKKKKMTLDNLKKKKKSTHQKSV